MDGLVLPTSKNTVERVRQIVHMVCISYFSDVTARELDVLYEYVLHGRTHSARASFILNNPSATKANFSVICDRLYKKGILLNNPIRQGKLLHPVFENVRKLYVEQSTPLLIVKTSAE